MRSLFISLFAVIGDYYCALAGKQLKTKLTRSIVPFDEKITIHFPANYSAQVPIFTNRIFFGNDYIF